MHSVTDRYNVTDIGRLLKHDKQGNVNHLCNLSIYHKASNYQTAYYVRTCQVQSGINRGGMGGVWSKQDVYLAKPVLK